MSSGTKVYKYRCNTCQRTVEQVSDNRRPDPLRCVITQECKGLLELQGSRRGDRARLTTPETDLADRIPRGSTFEFTAAPADPVLVPMVTFPNTNGLTIAGPRRTVVGAQAVYSILDTDGNLFELETRNINTLWPTTSRIDILVYEITAAVLSSQRYTFTFNSIAQLVEGIDDSKEARLMRFGPTDQLKVLVNGVELEDSQYDRSQDNVIRLTPGVVASEVTVEVYVFKDRLANVPADKLIRLTCKPLSTTIAEDLAFRQECAWGDVGRIQTNGIDRSLLYCTDTSGLEERKTYTVAYFEAFNSDGGSRQIDPDEIWLLLSDAPHSFVDKRLDEVIKGGALVQQKFSFTYDLSEATGNLVPVTDASAVTLLQQRLAPRAEARVTPASTEGAERAYTKRAEAFIIGPA